MAIRHILTGIGCIVLAGMIVGLGSPLSRAQEVVPLSPQPAAGTAAADVGGADQAIVHIADGKVSGQVVGLNGEATGQAGLAHVSFVQEGKVVATTMADGFGRFQVAGLPPGTYSVLVYGPDGISAVAVQVLPASSTVLPTAEGVAADATTTLTVDVVPATDSTTLETAMATDSGAPSVTAAQGTIPSDTPPQAPAGGGGGGGDAGAAALGAAAAAAGIGVGAASGLSGGGGGASPSQ